MGTDRQYLILTKLTFRYNIRLIIIAITLAHLNKKANQRIKNGVGYSTRNVL